MEGLAEGGAELIPRPRIDRGNLAITAACVAMLAAVAVPLQSDVGAEVRRTEVAALARSIEGAARLGHSLWQAAGAPAVLETGRGRVAIVNGYPAAADLPLLLEKAESLAFAHERGMWTHRDAGSCGVRYAPPDRRGGSPILEPDLTGC